jgi:hypothetical protein
MCYDISTSGDDLMSSQTRHQLKRDQHPEEDQDNRGLWERPVFRRLVANNAESGSSNLDDGSCMGTGSDFHHSCHRVSDIRLKREVALVGQLDKRIGLYRFKYLWGERDYVGVMAHEVAAVVPDAVAQDTDGYLRVNYARIGLKLQTWEEWTRDQPIR